MDPSTWLLLCRTVRFGETDAAGVMHFHQLLRWCHEAYEESLERFGIAPSTVFPRPVWPGDQGDAVSVGLPIVHCRADYLRPLRVGDPLAISLEPRGLDPGQFEVGYSFRRDGTLVAQGLTRHLAITANDRRRCALPEALRRWLEASGLGVGVREI
jgi:1,4-dihydroxy-2-naphthoyl-CoA hydrolase